MWNVASGLEGSARGARHMFRCLTCCSSPASWQTPSCGEPAAPLGVLPQVGFPTSWAQVGSVIPSRRRHEWKPTVLKSKNKIEMAERRYGPEKAECRGGVRKCDEEMRRVESGERRVERGEWGVESGGPHWRRPSWFKAPMPGTTPPSLDRGADIVRYPGKRSRQKPKS